MTFESRGGVYPDVKALNDARLKIVGYGLSRNEAIRVRELLTLRELLPHDFLVVARGAAGIPRSLAEGLGSTYAPAWWEPLVWLGGTVLVVLACFLGWLVWVGSPRKGDTGPGMPRPQFEDERTVIRVVDAGRAKERNGE